MGMGNRIIELEERGFGPAEGMVCSQCIQEPYLHSLIQSRGGQDRCDFCDQVPTKPECSLPLEDLMPCIVHGINVDFEDPNNAGVPVDGGEYVIEPMVAMEIVPELEITDCMPLQDAIVHALSDSFWVQRDWADEPPSIVTGWRDFKYAVTTARRYTFLSQAGRHPSTGRGISLNQVPAELVHLISTASLVTTIPAGTTWWRARPHDTMRPWPTTAKALGSPPSAVARDNRMAPKGIAVFSGADQEGGALAEVLNYADKSPMITVAQFEQLRDMRMVDLRNPPVIPSVFDPSTQKADLTRIRFLHSFIADLTRPTSPDDESHLDYIPSQIIAEHLRYDLDVDGLLWTSAADRKSTVCALFLDNDEMAEPGTVATSRGKQKAMRLIAPTVGHRYPPYR